MPPGFDYRYNFTNILKHFIYYRFLPTYSLSNGWQLFVTLCHDEGVFSSRQTCLVHGSHLNRTMTNGFLLMSPPEDFSGAPKPRPCVPKWTLIRLVGSHHWVLIM